MFLGMQFLSDDYSFSETAAANININKITLTNGIYDYLFGSDNPDVSNKEWDYDTRFYAKFQNNLFAGNVDYAAEIVSSVRIKRCKRGENNWITLYSIPINNNSDFNFELFDKYAQGNQDYYYSLVPVIGNIEGNINKNELRSEFVNYFILDKDVTYPIIFNTKLNMEINKPSEVVVTLGKQYPFVVSNGISQYRTGTLSFALAPIKDCELDNEEGYNYRTTFEQWIMNGQPKIIKDWSGKIYMIKVKDNISIDYEYNDFPSYQISFAEIGNPLNMNDMYYNNFSDVNFLLSSAYL